MSELAIHITAGDSKNIDIYATELDGSPMNLAGCAVVWSLAAIGTVEALLVKVVGDGISSPASGIIRVELLPDDTAGLPAKYYEQQVRIREADGAISTLDLGISQIRIRTAISGQAVDSLDDTSGDGGLFSDPEPENTISGGMFGDPEPTTTIDGGVL